MDVVVSDIRMPGTNGIDVVRILRERGDTTPVILLTTFDDSALMLAAVEAGAQGFLLKDASAEDLSAAIRAVAAGETLLQPVSMHGVRANWSTPGSMPAATHLTEREVSILRLVSSHDVGRAINPVILEGQILGGAAQGLGYAMTEGFCFDPRTGTALNQWFLDLRTPSILDIPDIEPVVSVMKKMSATRMVVPNSRSRSIGSPRYGSTT